MSDIIKGLAEKATANLIEAQEAVLGFRSGPGIDIKVTTTQPITGDRTLVPVTSAGQSFLNKFYQDRTIPLAELHKFTRLAAEWGLSFTTVWEVEEL